MSTDTQRRVLDRPAEEILRPAAAWVWPTAGRAVALYEERLPADSRPRAAVEAAQEFADGGTLYPILNRLESDGLLTSSWREGVGGPLIVPLANYVVEELTCELRVLRPHPYWVRDPGSRRGVGGRVPSPTGL